MVAIDKQEHKFHIKCSQKARKDFGFNNAYKYISSQYQVLDESVGTV